MMTALQSFSPYRTGLMLALLIVMHSAWSADDAADNFDNFEFESFDDAPLPEALEYPDWFKLSFLDLGDDLEEALTDGKQGIMVYLGQKHCAYCKQLLEVNFGKPDIRAYTEAHFDAIGLDIHGQRPVTDIAGHNWDERSFAVHQKVNFTPTLLFYDDNRHEALRLTGYYPPYKFRAALEYVADGYYLREDFRSYLARADVPLVFDNGALNYEDFFTPPPYALDRSRLPGERMLIVFFEQPDCHACDILHTGPLQETEIRDRTSFFDVTQLNIRSDTPVITPSGERTTARRWAENLGIFYTPTLLFFDEQGDEILRLDSVVQFYRLRNVLDYALTGSYLEYSTFQQWRSAGMP